MLAVTSSPVLPAKPFHTRRQFRLFKRRRLKIKASIPPFENLFNTLIAQNPSVNSLDLITPALGFASGAALFFSRFKPPSNSSLSDIGDWILFASPTPFNRFVLLRCPSISFQGIHDVNDRLVREEKHYVTVNSGRIQVSKREKDSEEKELSYQRVCVSAKDGGVISLDWPAELDLEQERGLDSTLLLVPGTPQGSLDDNIRFFVIEALKRGFFPIVMNPRGCAASPLTTPRLFTAADSDDICTAITYINNARPWTTLMGVGWGYGANMLTKYLAEVGEKTPLTAATCIDNPFDLDEATRTSPYHIVTDEKLTGGLVDILQTNKVLFQGKTKGFDVEKALLAKSVRDFEEAISMVSYGFVDIEDFYRKSSTRNMIKDVKIPVLFIQSDNRMIPGFSVPRNLIAENPFTSLLLCSCLPSSAINADISSLSWCQLVTIEWLTAVELGLLKGRHPLLTDIDVTINPSKGLTVADEVRPDKNPKVGKLLELTRSDAFNGYSIDPIKDLLEESKNGASLRLRSQQDPQRKFEQGDMSLQVKIGPVQQISSTDRHSSEEENVASEDSEHGHVLQTTQVVINMLDVTMPGTLTEEKKNKVLTAVGRGETIMKALEDAVPEDVRGKLTDAVSGILHAQGSDMKFDRILGITKPPNSSSGLKNQEKIRVPSAEVTSEDQSSSHQIKSTSISGSDNVPSGMDDPAEGTETEVHPIEKSQSSTDSAQSHESNKEVGSSGFLEEAGESRDNDVRNEELKGKAVPDMDHSEKGLEMGSKSFTFSQLDGTGGCEVAVDTEQKSQNSGVDLTDREENSISKVDQKSQHLSADQSKTSTDEKEEPSSPPMSSENQAVEGNGNNENKDINNMQNISPQTNSTSSDSGAPGFSVSQAFDAFTGMDDSTQVAVNSVFGVIENMLTQLEKSSDNEDEVKDGKDVEHKLEEQQKIHTQSNDSRKSGNPFVDDLHDGMPLKNDSFHTEEQPTQSLSTINGSSLRNSPNCYTNDYPVKKASNTNTQLIDKRFLVNEGNVHRHINRVPELGSYGDSQYNKHQKIPTKTLDSDTRTALLLDYFPDEGQWKPIEQPPNMEVASANAETYKVAGRKTNELSSAKSFSAKQYIEPSYVILDTEKQREPVKEFIATESDNRIVHTVDDRSEESIQFVKNRILDSLKLEIGRKLNPAEMLELKSELAGDLEQVANAVSLAVINSIGKPLSSESQGDDVEGTIRKVGTLDGEHIIRVISSSVQQTSCLRQVIPVGVIVGSVLAALRKYFNVASFHENGQERSLAHDGGKKSGKKIYDIVGLTEEDELPEEKTNLDHPIKRVVVESELGDAGKNTVMVGAVTAAIGASALLMHQKDSQGGNESGESSTTSMKKRHIQKKPEELEEEDSENQSNVITSLAEKAMSVASPVVPTKESGEVDQDRLVAMLADLGQKGGLLRLVGKLALLWGGIRGAMSLTNKLMSFSHIAERPLSQRIFGFVGMILVLWSPVVVPLLPTIVQGWTTKSPSKIAEFACIIGLYSATIILVMLWGKRIRGYDNTFEQYGLDLTSPHKLIEFFKAMVGGVIFVFSVHAVNACLGFASFSWLRIPPSLDAMTWLKVYGQLGLLVVQGTVMASAISLVEELLFRSWLPQEIAVDLGYHHGIIISGLAFSFMQRSLHAIPGLLLLSLSLSGARQRNGGSLSIPIGLRTGMLASTFILQKGGILTYNSKGNFPLWIIGSHPYQPFSGLVGLAFSLLLVIILYPRQTSQERETPE